MHGSSSDFIVGEAPAVSVEIDQGRHVVVRFDAPCRPGDPVTYGAGRLGHAGIVDDAGFPLPFFGPIAVEAT